MRAIKVDITSDEGAAATFSNIFLDTANVTSGLFKEQRVNSNGTVLGCDLPNPHNLCLALRNVVSQYLGGTNFP